MDKNVVIRTVVLVVALLNQTLLMMGLNPLPFSEEEVFAGVTAIFTVVASLITWYKNNDVTDEGRAGTEYMKELKEKKKQGK